MEREKGILQLADYYEKFEVGNSSAYLIINENMRDYKAMFGFTELSDKKDEWEELFHLIEEKAKALAEHAKEVTTAGGKYCDCGACAGAKFITEHESEMYN